MLVSVDEVWAGVNNPLILTEGQVLGTVTLPTSKHYAKEAAASVLNWQGHSKRHTAAMFNGREPDQSFSPRGLSDGVVLGQMKDNLWSYSTWLRSKQTKGSNRQPRLCFS